MHFMEWQGLYLRTRPPPPPPQGTSPISLGTQAAATHASSTGCTSQPSSWCGSRKPMRGRRRPSPLQRAQATTPPPRQAPHHSGHSPAGSTRSPRPFTRPATPPSPGPDASQPADPHRHGDLSDDASNPPTHMKEGGCVELGEGGGGGGGGGSMGVGVNAPAPWQLKQATLPVPAQVAHGSAPGGSSGSSPSSGGSCPRTLPAWPPARPPLSPPRPRGRERAQTAATAPTAAPTTAGNPRPPARSPRGAPPPMAGAPSSA